MDNIEAWQDVYASLLPWQRQDLRCGVPGSVDVNRPHAYARTGRTTVVTFDGAPTVMRAVFTITCRARARGATPEATYEMLTQRRFPLGRLIYEAYTFGDYVEHVWSKTDRVKPTASPASARAATVALFVAQSSVSERTVNGVVVPRGGVTEAEWFRASGVSKTPEFRAVVRDVVVSAGLVEVYPSPGRGRPTVYMPAMAPELFTEALERHVADYARGKEKEGLKLRQAADARNDARELRRKVDAWTPDRETRQQRRWREADELREAQSPGFLARRRAQDLAEERRLAEYVASGQRDRDLDALVAVPLTGPPATLAELQILAARRT